jgi:hypothetical protein
MQPKNNMYPVNGESVGSRYVPQYGGVSRISILGITWSSGGMRLLSKDHLNVINVVFRKLWRLHFYGSEFKVFILSYLPRPRVQLGTRGPRGFKALTTTSLLVACLKLAHLWVSTLGLYYAFIDHCLAPWLGGRAANDVSHLRPHCFLYSSSKPSQFPHYIL